MIARRDLWRGIPWVGTAAIVIQDEPELLAVYVAEGAEIAVLDGDSYPIAHPWRGNALGQSTESSSSVDPAMRTRSGSSGRGRDGIRGLGTPLRIQVTDCYLDRNPARHAGTSP